MRKCIILLIILLFTVFPVSAMEFNPPQVPDSGETVMPDSYDSFGAGLWYIIRKAMESIQPEFLEACGICLALVAVILLTSIVKIVAPNQGRVISVTGSVMVGCLLLRQSQTFVSLALEVIAELNGYGKLLLPVMATALAAQGGTTTSAALYGGTVIFNSILTSIITTAFVPAIYFFLSLSLGESATGNKMLKDIKNFMKWFMTWFLKISIYLFTGYLGITGVVSGTADAAAIKAAKLALSGFVPVVGGIISDASETILLSAGVMKSAVGIYGLLAITSLFIGPFLKIAIQYLLLKVTSAACRTISGKDDTVLIGDFSVAVGFLLAVICTIGVMLFVSTVCFMRGVI